MRRVNHTGTFPGLGTLATCLLVGAASVSGLAQTPTPPSPQNGAAAAQQPQEVQPLVGQGTTTEVKIKSIEKDPFEYEPINPVFWESITYNMNLENYIKVIVSADRYLKDVRGNVDDESEGKLALAMGMEHLGFSYGATSFYVDLVKKRLGTHVGIEALRGLNRIAQSNFYDKDEVGSDILSNNEFGPLPKELQSFVGFHAGIYNLTHGFKDWSDANIAMIEPNSFWYYQMEYLRALGDVARNKLDFATQRLEKIWKEAGAFPFVQRRATVQYARAMFEKGDYDKAYELYRSLSNIDLAPREFARVLVERAWTRFYQRDYSRALGEIAVLEAPVYRNFIPFESYVIKMLTLKELCHYDQVFATAKVFRERYLPAIEQIKKRVPLKSSTVLARYALLNQQRQYNANMINQLREEVKKLKDYNFLEIESMRGIFERYAAKENELKSRIEEDLEIGATEAAEQLLDIEEQVSFLDYAAKLDSLRVITKAEDRRYESEKITYLKFDRIYWPVTDEYWQDELGDFKTLINSRCDRYDTGTVSNPGQSAPKSKGGKKGEFD